MAACKGAVDAQRMNSYNTLSASSSFRLPCAGSLVSQFPLVHLYLVGSSLLPEPAWRGRSAGWLRS